MVAAGGQAADPSTLAALHPAQPRELRYRVFKTSARLSGSHRMTLRRVSRAPEFSRLYAPGDPVRLIDWKAYARTDQLLVREVRDEAAARVLIALDISETMRWPDSAVPVDPPPPTKVEVATRVALHLAHLHVRMGDFVEVWVLDGAGKPRRQVVPRSPSDVVSVFDRLVAGGYAPAAFEQEFAAAPFNDARTRDLAYAVTDALSGTEAPGLAGLGRRGLLIHVLSSLETDIRWIRGETSYFDLGAGKKEYQGAVLRHRDNYLKHLDHWRSRLAARLKRRGAEYVGVTDATSIGALHHAVAAFGAHRQGA